MKEDDNANEIRTKALEREEWTSIKKEAKAKLKGPK